MCRSHPAGGIISILEDLRVKGPDTAMAEGQLDGLG